ncbi:MAG: hypothetical protein V1871_04355 [Planctomycetota bacterium]
MKLKSVYYYDEPKDLELDCFEVRVLTEPESDEKGGYDYALKVTTIKFIQDYMTRKGMSYFCAGKVPLLIVQRLDNDTVISAIKYLLPEIDEFGLRIE